jgi:hypothetical protein
VILSVQGISVVGDESSDDYSLYLEVMDRLEYLTPTDVIEVRMGTEKDEYMVGDPFEVRFMVSDACYMVLMDIGTVTKDVLTEKMGYGAITFLVPSYKVLENKIEPGRVYSSLYDFNMKIRVAPPAGVETVNLFCSRQPLNLVDSNFDQEKIYTIEPHEDQKLQKLLQQLEHLEEAEWSGSSVSFLIKEPGSNARPIPKKFGALPPMGATGTTGKFFPPVGKVDPTTTP